MTDNSYRLLSTIGAIVAGLGLGAILQPWLGSAAVAVIIVGLAVHGLGMAGGRRVQRTRLENYLYWGCWVALGGLAAFLLGRLIIGA